MRFAEVVTRHAAQRAALVSLLALAACGGQQPARISPPPPPAPSAVPAPAATSVRPEPLPVLRSQQALELHAARRLAAMNPQQVYLGKPPEILLAVPVLRVDLHADGSVRRVTVLREPRQAKDTIQLAVAAVHRAAPYGDVSRMPEPRMFVETFLFDDARRFKPRGLQ